MGATVGFPRETGAREHRTIATPELVRALCIADFDVVVERGVGRGVGFSDRGYAEAGARVGNSEEAWAAGLVLRYKPGPPSDLDQLAPGQAIAALWHAEGDRDVLTALCAARVRAWSYEFVYDAARGCFPLAVAGGQIAGVQAIHAGQVALWSLHGGRGVQLGHVAGAPPARVVVIGSGHVGASAAATAAALGAHVSVLTHTELAQRSYANTAPAGVEVVVNTRAALLERLAEADLVIGAILESTFDTPAMITRPDLAVIHPGAIIVDVTAGYGLGYLPTCGEIQHPGALPRMVDGIGHVKVDVWPSLVPRTATHAYGQAATPYLVRLAHVALRGADDPLLGTGLIASDGRLTHSVVRRHAEHYGMTA